MEMRENQFTNLETCASRYVVLALAYNKLKDPHITREEREVYEKRMHEMLDLGPGEFEVIRDLVGSHVGAMGV